MKGRDVLDWVQDSPSWPHSEKSSFHEVKGIRWHVQTFGAGPPILLIHGTGASTHSWRDLAPMLAEQFSVIAVDLPGHAFTSRPRGEPLSLPVMAEALAALLDDLQLEPVVVIGHSAGAAIGIRCCLDGRMSPEQMIGINSALLPFRGPAGYLFPPLAKLLFVNPLTPRIFARSARSSERVRRLIKGTGSKLDAEGIDYYVRLFRSPDHVAATLGMMANWDLYRFARELPDLKTPLILLVGEQDLAVSPSDAEQISRQVPDVHVVRMPGLGHLAHEEDPAAVAQSILSRIQAQPDKRPYREGQQ
jgi:magnesium chelatase accessory protein